MGTARAVSQDRMIRARLVELVQICAGRRADCALERLDRAARFDQQRAGVKALGRGVAERRGGQARVVRSVLAHRRVELCQGRGLLAWK